MVTSSAESTGARSFTPKGRATRDRIVSAASTIILEQGVKAARLDEIQAAAHVSASQLYHYFDDKSALLHAVIDYRSTFVLGSHRAILDRLDSFDALEEWRDMIVTMLDAQECVGGCPLGSLASGLVEADPIAREALERSFAEWERMLSDGLTAMRDNGELRQDVDADALATSILAGVQGGFLLSQTRRDSASVRIAIDASIGYLRTMRPSSSG